MAGLFAGDIVQISLRGRIFGQRILLTRFYKVTVPSDAALTVEQELAGLLAGINATIPAGGNELVSKYLTVMPNNYSLETIRAQLVWPNRSVLVEQIADQTGQSLGAATVSNTAVVITMRTAKAGRNQVSNVHIGPVDNEVYSAGFVTGPAKPSYNLLGVRLAIPLTSQNIGGCTTVPVIYHAGQELPQLISDDIRTHVLQDTIRVMRRRTVGLGE